MEVVVPTTFMKSLIRGHWRGRRRRRNGYERLGGSRRRLCPETNTVALQLKKPGGGSSHRRRRFWRIRPVGRKLQLFRWCSPKKWLVRFRDAYVNMMLSLAKTRTIGTGYAGSLESGYYGSGRYAPAVKEYEEKMIVQIYRMIVAQSRLAPQNGVAAG